MFAEFLKNFLDGNRGKLEEAECGVEMLRVMEKGCKIKLFDDSLAVGSLTSRFHNTKIGNSIDEDEYVL